MITTSSGEDTEAQSPHRSMTLQSQVIFHVPSGSHILPSHVQTDKLEIVFFTPRKGLIDLFIQQIFAYQPLLSGSTYLINLLRVKLFHLLNSFFFKSLFIFRERGREEERGRETSM